MLPIDGLIFIILTIVAVASVLAKKLTIPAAIAGWIIGGMIYFGSGLIGVVLTATFFILGTVSTSVGIKQKNRDGLAEEDKGKRKAGQVIANAGVAAILALIACFDQSNRLLYTLMTAASFSSATADTLSSELGNVYGRKFYNILTIKKDLKGLNGVVSVEGTFAGVVGSIVIAITYSIALGLSSHFLWIIIAGTAGNLLDSILGATLERRRFLNNNAVNFLNTATAAVIAGILSVI